jgi:hypothetical protein
MDARPFCAWTAPIALAVLCQASTAFAATPSRPVLEPILQQWARASADVRPAGNRERERLLQEHHGELSAHEIDAICRLSGPVDAEGLRNGFDWTAAARPDGSVLLTGRPRDEIESLFYRQVEVAINAHSGLPESFHFINHDGRPKTEELIADIRGRTDTAPLPLVNESQQLRVASLADLNELRPVPRDDRTARVAAILAGWERATQADRVRAIHFQRLWFDVAEGIEHRAAGTLRADAHGFCHLHLTPAAIAPGETSVAISANGRAYRLQAEVAQDCVFHRDNPPTFDTGIHLAGFQADGSLPGATRRFDAARFLSAFNAQAAQQTHQVTLLGDGPNQYHLELRPRDPAVTGSAEILLDKQTLQPTALRRLGPDGETEVIYLIDAIETTIAPAP